MEDQRRAKDSAEVDSVRVITLAKDPWKGSTTVF